MDSEASILLAITAVNNGLALKAAARQFGVPYSTLARRHQGGNSREHYRKGLQFLSPGEEEELVKLIHYMVSQGLPPVRRFIQQFARDVSGRQIERSWFRGFISRHPEIKHLEAKKLESDRAAVTSDEIKEFFEKLHAVIAEFQIDYRDIWNMDETGTHFGESAHRIHVYTSVGSKQGRTITLPKNGRLVSSIEAISAEGKTIPSYFIQKGVLFEEHQLPAEEALRTKRFFLARTKGGFSSRETGLDWLTSVFIPFSKSPRSWRLLILDGHVSHTATPFWQTAWLHKVYILRLPPPFDASPSASRSRDFWSL
jgi:helix-turn-helix, Psq domain/DDE superfamily endonuclease